jgi:hypothetical protein
MPATHVEVVKLRRPASVGLVALLATLLVSACGSGSEEASPSSGSAPQNAARKAEWLEAAAQVAAPGGDAALAVDALRAGAHIAAARDRLQSRCHGRLHRGTDHPGRAAGRRLSRRQRQSVQP